MTFESKKKIIELIDNMGELSIILVHQETKEIKELTITTDNYEEAISEVEGHEIENDVYI